MSTTLFAQRDITRDVGNYDIIKASNGVEVSLVEGKPGEITIEARGVDLEDIETTTSRGVLRLRIRNYAALKEKPRWWSVRIEVPVDRLEGVYSSTGAEVTSRLTIKSSSFIAQANTGGQMELTLDVDKLEVRGHTGSDVDLRGQANDLIAIASMGSDVDLFDLEAERVRARSNMGASLKVYALGEATVSANMGASLDVRGNPRYYSVNTGLGGDVSPKN